MTFSSELAVFELAIKGHILSEIQHRILWQLYKKVKTCTEGRVRLWRGTGPNQWCDWLRIGQTKFWSRSFSVLCKCSRNTLAKELKTLELMGVLKVEGLEECTVATFRRFRQYQKAVSRFEPPRRKKPIKQVVKRPSDPIPLSLTLAQWKQAVKEARAAGPVTPSRHPNSTNVVQLEFDTSPAVEMEAAELVAQVFNNPEIRSEAIPPVEMEALSEKTLQHAERLVRENPDPKAWANAVRKLGDSLWITGQVASANGQYFNPQTAFQFLVFPGKLKMILKGYFDPDPLKSWKPSLHNMSEASRKTLTGRGSSGRWHEKYGTPNSGDLEGRKLFQQELPLISADEKSRTLEKVRKVREGGWKYEEFQL